ncbi:MAG: hypothetical protein HDT22_05445 [Ruminococcus sp.]|nr:hypothetical protein [Ruminococcus sp.]
MIIFYIIIIITTAILAILSAEYQECYRKEKIFSMQNIKINFLQKPMHFIIFLVLHIVFAILAVLFYQRKNLNLVQLPQYIIFWDCILLSAWIDFLVKKIPNLIFLILLAVRGIGILAEMIFYSNELFQVLLTSFSGMLIGGAIVLACRLISRGGIGAGDVKLFALIGFYFGVIPAMNILFYTTFLASMIAIILLIGKKAKMKSTLALGPFVFIGLNVYYILLS